MKSVAISIIMIVAITAFTIIGTVYTERSLTKIAEYASGIPTENIEYDEVLKYAEELEMRFKEDGRFLSLTVCEELLWEAEKCITDVKSAAMASSAEGVITAKSRLTSHLEQLKRLSGFSIEAIF